MKNTLLESLNSVDWSGINAEYFTHKFYDTLTLLGKKCLQFGTKEIAIKDKSRELDFKHNFNYSLNEQIIISKILQNIKQNRNWAKEISFKDAIYSKDINSVFVPLDFYLTPKSTHFNTENEPKISLKEIDFFHKNVVILGGPGAGKTTLMKKVFIDELEKSEDKKNFLFPLVIQFRYIEDINSTLTIHELLYDYFGIDIKIHLDVNNILGRYERILKKPEVDIDNYDAIYDVDNIDQNYVQNETTSESIDYTYLEEKYKVAKGVYEELSAKYKKFREQLITEFIDK